MLGVVALSTLVALVVPSAGWAGAVRAAAQHPDVAGEPVPFGDAGYFGSPAGTHLAAPVVGMAATPTGHGYWLVGSDGGVFSYGKAAFHGSAADLHLKASVTGMAATPTGHGYWLVASNGGVFSYGAAKSYGSAADLHLAASVVGMAATPTGHGYWLVASNGQVLTYGAAKSYGSIASQPLESPVVAMAAALDGDGYWLLPSTPPTLGPGATGPAVLALQQRLSSLGYWLGTPNGTFGDTTEQAVYALQKAAGLTRDGIVGPSTYAALDRGVLPRPQSTSGYVIEVDLQDDLVMFVTNGKLENVLNTSTGGGYTYTATGAPAIAETPEGHFQIYSEVNGWVVDSLGALWRPKYFTSGGFAIHGDTYVPPIPVSHGCVRVSIQAIDWIWTDDKAPLGTAVWVY